MIHWSFVLSALIWAYVIGEKRGYKQAYKLVLGWRQQSRGWRYAYERATAKNEAEIDEVYCSYIADIAEIKQEAA